MTNDPQDLLKRLLARKGIRVGSGATEPAPRPSGEAATLSFAQERLWFLQRLEPASRAYHLGQSFLLRGAANREALGLAIDDLLRRHESLRTGFFVDEAGCARPRTAPASTGAMDFADLSGLLPSERAAGAAAREERIFSEPFYLSRPPLFRALLLKTAPDLHRLSICVHHLVFDGWSIAVLARDLAALYAARSAGREPSLVPLPLTYSDYAAWQKGRASEQPWREALEWWENHLRGLPPLELTADRPRPARASGRGAGHRFVVPGESAARLRELARREGTTLFTVLLAAYEALLHRHSARAEFGVGVSVAGRTHRALEDLVGMFVNTVVFRADLSGDPSFSELVRRTRTEAQEVLARQETPFEQIVDRLQTERDLSRNPLFQAGLFLQNAPAADFRIGDAALEPVAPEIRAAKFDLLVSLEEVPGGGLAGLAEYSTDLFDPETIARLCERFRVLLASAASAPERRLSGLDWVPAPERNEARRWSEGPIREFPFEGWIHEWPGRQKPDATALIGPDGEPLSYGAFCSKSERLARALRALGAGPEALVGVCLERSVELVLALHAVLRAGAAFVPLDPGYPGERLAWMAGDAGAAIVITTRGLAARLPGCTARMLFIEEPWPEGRAAPPFLHGLNAAYMIYTSGSTGRPKGAVNSHEGILNLMRWVQRAYPISNDDVALLKTPFSFDVSLREFFWPLMCGARLAVAEPGAHRDPARLAELIRERGVTIVNFVPSVFRAFLDAPGAARCTSLRRVLCTGEELTRDLVEKCRAILGCELVNLYGPTEAAVEMTDHACGQGSGPVPIGRPIDNMEVHILDEALFPVPRGVPGELHLGGVGLGRGYHRRPELTAERWVPDPGKPGRRLYRTGDLGRWRTDGSVEYLGRADFQVKLRGQRIELGEIESALLAHPGVREAAVVLREARLVAYTASRSGAVPPDELRGWLSARLPEYMVPTGWVELPALPLTTSGKTDRKALPAPPAAASSYQTPRGDREEALAECWREVLKAPRVGRDESYFDLGGDSILSIQVQARARARGWDFDLADLFQHPTLAALALALRPAAAEAEGRDPAPYSLLRAGERARLPQGLEDAYPLAALQAGMVLHADLEPESSVYHEVFSYEVRAPWNERALREALSAAARRHPVLRTSFALSGLSEPVQLVHSEVPIPFEAVDARGGSRSERDAAISGWIESELARGFEWAEPPLWRAMAWRHSDDSWEFSLSVHHAILDGWSAATLLAELFRDTLDRCGGGEPAARRPPPSFARYVALERDAISGGTSGRFWADQLADAPSGRMPRRRARVPPARRGQASARHSWRGGELAALRSLAARAGVSLKHVLLAAHLKVVEAYTAQRDAITGVISNGRPEEARADEALGLFLNTVPLRLHLGRGSWLELLGRVFRADQAAWPHRRFPLAEMQRAQGRRALFDTVFNYVHYHGLDELRARSDVELLNARYFDENSFSYFAQYNLDTVRDELELDLRYDSAEFTAEQAGEFAQAAGRALALMAGAPAALHCAETVLSAREIERVVRTFNSEEPAGGAPRLLHETFLASADRVPGAVALVDGGRRLSYAELSGRVHAWSARLKLLGAGPETLVGVCLERGADLVTALLAVLESGAAYVPLDPAYPTERLAFICADAQIRVLVSRPGLASRLPAGSWTSVDAAELAALPPVRSAAPCPAMPANLAYLIYTSGSTGRPKAAAIEHRSACALVAWARAAHTDRELSGVLFSTSVCFDLSVFELFATFAAGGRVIVAENALALASIPARAEVTLINTVPSAAAELLRQRAIPDSVRVFNLAGERLTAALADQIYSLGTVERVQDLYGPSEDTTYSTWARRTPGGPETIGRVLPGSQLYLLGEDFQPAPPGGIGEIHLGGAGLARGYLARPDLTAERFLPDPFSRSPGGRIYRTGDLARMREDGQVEFLGRADQQVKIRGYRIELGEIQAVLDAHPAVSESAVLAREDGGRSQLVAYVAGESLPAALDGELRAWVAARLPEAFVPSLFVALRSLPRTPNGKLDRAALPAAASRTATGPERAELRTSAERALAAIWSEVLRVPEIGAEDNYFSLGGDSILALQVSSRARDAGLAVAPRLIFENPTLRALAAAAGSASPREAGGPERRAEAGGLTPIQHWFFSQEFEEPHHWNQSLLLRARAPVDAGALERAFAAVGSRHSALRRRFERDGRGRWRSHPSDGAGFAFSSVALPAASELAAQCAAAQSSLDLARGPLARAIWFSGDAADPGRLFIAIHHLAVDAVSWRILLEDLAIAYEAVRFGREPGWPPPSASPSDWSGWLGEFAGRGGFSSERSHWAALAALAEPPLPRDLPGAANTVEAGGLVESALNPRETDALLRRALAVHGCRIDDLLLAALALTLREWTGREAHSLHLEGHGREAPDSGMDLGRAVGWFTTLYPVRLDLRGAAEATRALGAVRAQLAAVPRRGLGYGAGRFLSEPPLWGKISAEICFNYLGQFDGWLGGEAPFIPAEEQPGFPASPRGRRPHFIEINGLVAGGALRFDWRYPTGSLKRETVHRLAERHLTHLRVLIESSGPPLSRAAFSGTAETELDRAIAEIEF